jgi:uncharacterized protein (DUF58 family)
MKWTRHEEGIKSVYQGMGLTLILFLFSFIYSQQMLAASFLTVFVVFAIQNVYYEKVGANLKVHAPETRYRYLIGTHNDLKLEFKNGSIPIWNGTLTVYMEDSIATVDDEAYYFSGIFEVSVPFAIGRNESVSITLPMVGYKRGVARITRLLIDIPHLFGDGSVQMELAEAIPMENIVYPKIIPFTGKLQPSPYHPGEIDQRASLFHDVFQPVGTRDYVMSDRFDQIHWNASARLQKLQTKEFMPVAAMSVLFILNAIEKPRSKDDFEKKIERLASYVDHCTRNGIPYSVAINLRTFGDVAYMHLSTATGKVHYQKTIEMLARLSERNAKLPFHEVLQSIESRGILPPSIVLITHEPENVLLFTKKWSRANHVVVDSYYEGSEDLCDNSSLKKRASH